jgi:hypothetical protein
MIYVLKSAGYDENNQYIDLLKIGYSNDWGKRKVQYLLHNPTIQTLYEIENLEEEWEHKLHYKFRKYRYKGYGNEWFYYREEILEYFKTHDTPDLIREDKGLETVQSKYSISKSDKIIVTRIISLWLIKDSGDDKVKFHNNSLRLHSIVKDVIRKSIVFNMFNINSVYNTLETDYNVPSDVIKYIKEELGKNYPEKIQTIINKFNYTYTTFVDRMKYLCGQKSILEEAEFNIILSLVPIDYRNYLTIFTVEEISSCKYRKADLKEKFNSKKGNQGIEKNLILQVITYFQIGQRYSKSEIKEKLKEIYKNLGYNSTPKASDIEQWFEIKSVLLSENGKRVAGFEIIKKKGD